MKLIIAGHVPIYQFHCPVCSTVFEELIFRCDLEAVSAFDEPNIYSQECPFCGSKASSNDIVGVASAQRFINRNHVADIVWIDERTGEKFDD